MRALILVDVHFRVIVGMHMAVAGDKVSESMSTHLCREAKRVSWRSDHENVHGFFSALLVTCDMLS